MLYSRILVTGANGMLGQALIALLSRQAQYDVLATGLDMLPRFQDASCGYTRLDITNADELKQLFLDFSPDVVINAAAMTHVDKCEKEKEKCWQINVEGTKNLVKSCRATGAKLIHVSTDFIFDGEEGPYRENDRPNPVNYYGKSKLAAENAVRSLHESQWAIARTVLVIGTGQGLGRSNIALWVMEKLQAGETIHVVTDQWRTPTYVIDLADGIERIVRFNKTGVYHISGRDFMSVHAFAVQIAETLGLDTSLVKPTDSSGFTQPAKRPPRTGFIILKAETELSYKPHALTDAIHQIAKSVNATS